jgi:hypothetical protein
MLSPLLMSRWCWMRATLTPLNCVRTVVIAAGTGLKGKCMPELTG